VEAATREIARPRLGARLGELRRPRVDALPTLIAALALAAIVAGSLVVVIAAAQRPSFLSPSIHEHAPGWLTWPFGELWPGRTNDRVQLERELLVVLLAMTACYLAVLALARWLRPAIVWSAVAAVYVVCFLSPPLLLTDVFNYVDYARMGVLHGLNPYTHLPVATLHLHDPVYHLSNWHHLHSPYGPLFTLLTYALVPLGLAGSYWAFKAMLMLVSLATLALVARIARRLELPPLPAVVLVGLNPLVLLYGVGGQHMDMFMLALLLVALDQALARRERLTRALSVGAAAVKASAAVLVPLFVAGARRRWRALAGAAGGVLAFGGATVLAFGPHLPALRSQEKLVSVYSFPNVIGYLAGRGGEDATVRAVAQALLVAAFVACLAYAWRRRALLAPLGWLSLATLVTLGWDMPWYILWVLPFIAFVRARTFRVAAIAVCVLMTIQWLPLFPAAMHRIGVDLSSTPTWHVNALYEKSLLK
jgi:hypothetical protein